MTFNEKFKGYVDKFRAMDPGDFLVALVPNIERASGAEALDLSARLAAGFYYSGELIEAIALAEGAEANSAGGTYAYNTAIHNSHHLRAVCERSVR